MRIILKNFHIIDENLDAEGSVVIDDGIISEVKTGKIPLRDEIYVPESEGSAAMIIDGKNFIDDKNILPLLMPAFVDLHAHFREPAFLTGGSVPSGMPFPSETLESASLAAVAGGYGTVICMANTKPAIDTVEKASAIKRCSDVLGLIDLYPVLALSKNLEGKELSEITNIHDKGGETLYIPLMFSEDGKDMADDVLFVKAMKEAKRIGVPISCHCDFGGAEADDAKKNEKPRSIWSRIEENNAVKRVVELGRKTGCHIHIAHVSTKEAVEMIRSAKAELANQNSTFFLTCEAMPHNIALTEDHAKKLGEESFGRVNPPLRSEDDRRAIIEALKDGTVDAIATDHAPHSMADKEKGIPGFSGLETAFSVCNSVLIREEGFSFSFLSRLMSANPARMLGLGDSGRKGRGRIANSYRADLVIVDQDASWIVDPAELKTRGKNTPFFGQNLYGKIIMTLHGGKVVFDNLGNI